MITQAATASAEPGTGKRPGLIRGLTRLDSVLIVVGGVIGGAIFLTPKDVAAQATSPFASLWLWAIGGAISLLGCFAFAELGAMYPEAGGQFVYLREAYGEMVAFMYGWLMFIAGTSGGVASIAVSFAIYLGKVFPLLGASHQVFAIHSRNLNWTLNRADLLAVAAILVLTVVNCHGLRRTAILQNIATWIKFAAVAAFIILGIALGHGDWTHFHSVKSASPLSLTPSLGALGIAFVAIFWTYDGWVYVSWVAGEIKNPRRNIPISLVLGIVCVIAIYIGMNVAFLYAMPLGEVAKSEAVAESAAVVLFSPAAAYWLSLLIAISCFGALSINMLGGARVSYAMGLDGVFFRRMGNVHQRWRTPVFALVTQSIWATVLAVSGRYDQLFTYTEFAMIVSYCVTVIALFVLRYTQPTLERPYRCTGYPVLPALYVLVTGAWCLTAIVQRPFEALGSAFFIGIGLPGYWYWRRSNLQKS